MIDKNNCIQIVGYPNYFVVPSEIVKEDGTPGLDYKIFILKDDPFLEKEVVPNANGKVAMKSEKGVPQVLMYSEILQKVVEAAEQIKEYEKKKKERIVFDDSNLDKALVHRRKSLHMDYLEILDKVKKTTNFMDAMALKEECLAKEKALIDFDDLHPEYKPDKKKIKPHTLRGHDFAKANLTAEELEYKAQIEASVKEVTKSQDSLNLVIVEIVKEFGSYGEFKRRCI